MTNLFRICAYYLATVIGFAGIVLLFVFGRAVLSPSIYLMALGLAAVAWFTLLWWISRCGQCGRPLFQAPGGGFLPVVYWGACPKCGIKLDSRPTRARDRRSS